MPSAPKKIKQLKRALALQRRGGVLFRLQQRVGQAKHRPKVRAHKPHVGDVDPRADAKLLPVLGSVDQVATGVPTVKRVLAVCKIDLRLDCGSIPLAEWRMHEM